MTFIIYNVQKYVDIINTLVAELMTDRWYDHILQDIAQEEYVSRLKELRSIAKVKTKIS